MIVRDRALIVDDDPIFRIVTKELMQSLGWETVETADDGVEGLHMVKTQKPYDLILSDLNMPNMDGAAFVRELSKAKYAGFVVLVSSEDAPLLKSVQAMAIMTGVKLLGALPKPLTNEPLENLFAKSADTRFVGTKENISVSEIMEAVKSDRFLPYYQPKICIENERVTGVEVLARLLDEDRRIVTPDRFIDAAEKHGLMSLITDQLISKVIKDAARWNEAGYRLNIAINISPVMLTDRSLPDRLENQFKRAGLPLDQVTIEVTENRLVEHGADSLEVLSRLRLKGFMLSVDDFGTGATSFEQLQLYPFNQLKIDKSFIQSARTDQFAEATVKTSAQLARLLKMEIVAEGIESKHELEFAKSCGIEHAQGYLFSRPLPGEKLLAWLKTRMGSSQHAA